MLTGIDISDASASAGQNGASYSVSIQFDNKGSGIMADVTGDLAANGNMFAFTGGGEVLSAATSLQRVSGTAQIMGNFTQGQAAALAASLK